MLRYSALIRKSLPEDIDNAISRDGKVVHAKRENMIKERWHRAFLEEILKRSFPDADYLPTKVNGKFVDYTFYIGNDDFGLEIKNINPEGKSLGLGFTKNEIVARYTNEKIRGLVLSCSGFTENAKDILETENVYYAILPFQTTPSMSLKQWVKNKRVTVAFLSKYLNYSDPFRKAQKKAKSCPKSTNLSISIDLTHLHFEPCCAEFCKDLDHSELFRTCLANQVYVVRSKTRDFDEDELKDFADSIKKRDFRILQGQQRKRLRVKLREVINVE